MEISQLIDNDAAGPQKMRNSVAGMAPEQIDALPVFDKWSTRQVIYHLTDFEPVDADWMKHVIAEDQPSFAAEVITVSIVAGDDIAVYDPEQDGGLYEYWKAEARYWEAG